MARKKKKVEEIAEDIEVMSLDNKPINNEVIKNEHVPIPDKFVNLPPKMDHKKTIKTKNGRVYKELSNGYGMFADDGTVFKI